MNLPFAIRSLLFVPGSRPDRFAKALASPADCVCIDLEDAVPAAGKDAARAAVLSALDTAGEGTRLAVRINGLRNAAGLADLLALAPRPPRVVLVPMVEAAAELEIVHAVLGAGTLVIALIETVRGLIQGQAIAASPGVGAMMFGGADFAADLGVALAWEPLATARSQFVMACAAARVTAIDVPWVQLDDAAGLALEADRARALGFHAKAAIHPAQLAAINTAFAPTADALAEAAAAIAAFAAAGGAAVRFRGAMLEAPMMARYHRIMDMQGKIDA